MGSNLHPDWTHVEDEMLRGMWAIGKSASEIANVLPSRTRSAVIGRVHRLGLSSRPSPILPPRSANAPAPARKPRTPKLKPQAADNAPILGVPFPPTSPEEADRKRAVFAAEGKAAIAKTADVANDNAIPLLARRYSQCAWPVGTPARPAELNVCGAPVYEGLEACSYCLAHAQRAFQRDITQPRPKENLARAIRRWAA